MSESTTSHCSCSPFSPVPSPLPKCQRSHSRQSQPSRSLCHCAVAASHPHTSRVMSDRNLSPAPHPAKRAKPEAKRKPIQANSSLDVQISVTHVKTVDGNIIVAQPTRSTECESSSQRICQAKFTDFTGKQSPSGKEPLRSRVSLLPSDRNSAWELLMIERLLTNQPVALPRRRSKSPYCSSVSQSRTLTPLPGRSKSPLPSAQSRTSFSSAKKPSQNRSPFESDDSRTHQQRVFSEYFPGTFDSAPTSYQATARLAEPEDERMTLCFWGAGHRNAVNAVCVQDARVVLSASSDYTIGGWTLPRASTDPYKVDASVVRYGSVREIEGQWRGHKGRVLSVAALDRGVFCSGSEDCCVRVWRSETSSEVICPGIGPVKAVGHLTAGNIVVCSAMRIQQFDVSSRKLVTTFSNEHKANFAALLPVSATLFLTGAEDTSVKAWDARSGRCVHTLLGHSEAVTCLSVLADGKVMSGADDCTLRLWDLRSLRPLLHLTAPEEVKSVCGFDESLLFSGGESLYIWEHLAPRRLRVSTGTIRTLVAIPETNLLVAGGLEAKLGVWSVSR